MSGDAGSLRAVMDRDGSPADLLDYDVLYDLAGWTMRLGPQRPRMYDTLVTVAGDPAAGDADRADARWRLELVDDLEVRAWLLARLPAAIVDALADDADCEARPFTLERAAGPFRCSHCGRTFVAEHVQIVDRCELLAGSVGADDLRYCLDCVRAVGG